MFIPRIWKRLCGDNRNEGLRGDPLPRDKNAEACAVLLLRDGAGDPAPVVRHANELLAEHQRVREWLVWPEEDFPRTSTQKPRTNEIRQVVHKPDSGRKRRAQ